MRISDWSSDVCSSDLRFQDHLVLLNDSHAADALVVGYGRVVGRHQADDVLVAALFENVDPHMSVEEPVSFLFPGQALDDGRLDDADFADGGSDLAVLDRPPHWFGHGAQKLDLAKRNSQAGPFKGQFDFARRSEEHTSELQS